MMDNYNRLNKSNIINSVNKLESNNNYNPKSGFLDISIKDVITRTPFKNANMKLYRLTIAGRYAENAEAILIGEYYTDENGKIPLIELQVIDYPLNRYYALIDASGYNSITLLNIPIYENIKSIYDIELNRSIIGEPIREYIRIPTRFEAYSNMIISRHMNDMSNVVKTNVNDYNLKTGILETTVKDAETKIPIANALLQLYRIVITGENLDRAYSQLIHTNTTDINGIVPILSLPVIEYPSNRYFMFVRADGYNDVNVLNIPIYQNVNTKYDIEMHPKTTKEQKVEFIRTPTDIQYFIPPLWYF